MIDGSFAHRDLLPPVRALAREWRASPTTVLAVLSELAKRKILSTTEGGRRRYYLPTVTPAGDEDPSRKHTAIGQAIQKEIPAGRFGSNLPIGPHWMRIHPDNQRAGRTVARHLSALGHREIAVLTHVPLKNDWSGLRIRGIRDVYDGTADHQVHFIDGSMAVPSPPQFTKADRGSRFWRISNTLTVASVARSNSARLGAEWKPET